MTHPTTTTNGTTKPVISILEQVRADAARDALQTSRANEHDAWFGEGWEKGWQAAEADRKWWGRFCFACGFMVSLGFYLLVLR